MKKYINYLFKSTWLETAIITVSMLIFSIFFVLSNQSSFAHYNVYNDTWHYNPPYILLYLLLTTNTIAVILIIILRSYHLKSRNYADMIYALPISRRKLFGTHLLVGFIQVFITFTISFLGIIFTFIPISNNFFTLSYIWLLYPFTLLYICIIYGIFQLFILRAQNIFDSLGFVAGFIVLGLLIVLLLNIIDYNFMSWIFLPYYSFIQSATKSIYFATPPMMSLLPIFTPANYKNMEILIHFIVYLLISGLSIFYTLFTVKKESTDAIGGLSHSYFGYKVQIPLLIIVLNALFSQLIYSNNTLTNYLLGLVIIVSYFILYFIYKRSIKLSKYDFITFGSAVLIGLILGYIVHIN